MSRYRILVLYHKLKDYRIRKTIDEHLYAFRKYVDHVDFHYFNAAGGIPGYLKYANYDGVILHYTLLANRWNTDFFSKWRTTTGNLGQLKGYKVAIPQDEYAETDLLWEMFQEYGVETVFTCFSEGDFEKAYPSSKVNLKHRIPVLTGYIDEDVVREISEICDTRNKTRKTDIGYRARKLPFWLGRHALQKYKVGEVFASKAEDYDLKVDISNRIKDAFLGMDWYRFLCRCRVVLGCEGGASLMDSSGRIRRDVERYVSVHPDADFDEVEANCFPGEDYNINLFAVSPRHFECAITRTCQALMEGSYAGIFKPGTHYIEIKKDFSNIGDVFDKINDKEYCENIAENTYRDIVQSGKYTYRRFANMVVSHIIENTKINRRPSVLESSYFYILGKYLKLRERMEPLLVKLFYVWLAIKLYRFGIVRKIWKKFVRRKDEFNG
jgi:hypothetical protein